MEITDTPEGLVRRTLVKGDGRFLNFYNPPGEPQPINPDAEQAESQPSHADGLADTNQPGPIAGAVESGSQAFNANVGKGA